MLRLIRWRRRFADDRGAIAVLAALLMSTVLVGAALIAVDVGGLVDEHRQVRNGADAAALALAQSCVRQAASNPNNPCGSALGPTGVVAAVANGNAADGVTRVEGVCGTAKGLSSCPSTPKNASTLSTCPPVAAAGGTGTYGRGSYVEVRTATATSDGRNAIRPWFGRAAGVDRDSVVRSCARAAYGTPASVHTVVPFAVSRCVLDRYLRSVGKFATSSAGVSALSTTAKRNAETTTQLDAGVSIGADCLINISIGISFAGQGNFAFLTPARSSADCSVDTAVGARVAAFYGSTSLNTTCNTAMDRSLGQTVYVPVYDPDDTTGSRTNGQVTISGYAAFYVTGFNLVGNAEASRVTGIVPCRLLIFSSQCLTGIFVSGSTPVYGPVAPDADQYGVSATSLLA